jgi:hypothetical protein
MTVVSDAYLDKPLKDLWKHVTADNHIGQLITTSHASNRHLPLTARLTFNQEVHTVLLHPYYLLTKKAIVSTARKANPHFFNEAC